jgi:hypothetical protein
MAVTEAGLYINSVTHDGNSLGTPVGYAWDEQIDYVEIPAAGKEGPSAQGSVRKRLVAEVEYLEGARLAVEAVGTLIIKVHLKDGGERTVTITNMKTGTLSDSSGTTPTRFRQQFVHEGDMDTSPVAIAET